MVLNVPFSPVTGHFCGRVLRESTGRGIPAIVIWKFWVELAPVGDRLTGHADSSARMNTFLGAAANSVGIAMPTVPSKGTVEPANSAAT